MNMIRAVIPAPSVNLRYHEGFSCVGCVSVVVVGGFGCIGLLVHVSGIRVGCVNPCELWYMKWYFDVFRSCLAVSLLCLLTSVKSPSLMIFPYIFLDRLKMLGETSPFPAVAMNMNRVFRFLEIDATFLSMGVYGSFRLRL